MRRLTILLALTMAILLLVAGCGGKASPKDPVTTKGDTVSAEKEGLDKPDHLKASNGKENTSSPGIKTEGEKVGQAATDPADTKDGLVIKSENQVMAGSSQEIVKELDKELDALVRALDNMDTIDDTALDLD